MADLLMKDKVCLVTGASSGIGFVTARALARLGAEVVLVGRNEERCQAAVEMMRWENQDQPGGGPPISYLLADLSSMEEVRQTADAFRSTHTRLDVLVNNAGATFMTRQESADGFEMTWALNHLSYFLLTTRLLDMLQSTAAQTGEARVVCVSSAAHRAARLNFADLQNSRGYNGWRAYGQSKLANVLFAFELARRMQGSGVTANALHPGYVATGFGMNNGRILKRFLRLGSRFALTPEQGAETSIYLASSPAVRGISGCYFVRCRPTAADKMAYSTQTARKLWEVSEEQVTK